MKVNNGSEALVERAAGFARGAGQRRYGERGAAVAEFAIALLATVLLVGALAWGGAAVAMQWRCSQVAHAVARQAARHADSDVARLMAAAEPVRVEVATENAVVTVRAWAQSTPVAGLPGVDVEATAITIEEPPS